MPSGHLLIEMRNPTGQKKTLEPKCMDLDFIKMSLQNHSYRDTHLHRVVLENIV